MGLPFIKIMKFLNSILLEVRRLILQSALSQRSALTIFISVTTSIITIAHC